MQKFILEGTGVNRKTDKEIKFRVPASISEIGIEKFMTNVKIASLFGEDFTEHEEEFARYVELGRSESFPEGDRPSGIFMVYRANRG